MPSFSQLSVDAQFYLMMDVTSLIEDRARRLIRRSLQYSAREIEHAAKETTAYNDDTTATRESTVCFLMHYNPGRAYDAEEIAESIRPGSGIRTIEAAQQIGQDLMLHETLILTTGTWYTLHLERDMGGEHAFLGPTMDTYSPRAAQRVFRSLSRLFNTLGLDDGSDMAGDLL